MGAAVAWQTNAILSSETHILPEEEPNQTLIEFQIPQLFPSYTHINFLSLMFNVREELKFKENFLLVKT